MFEPDDLNQKYKRETLAAQHNDNKYNSLISLSQTLAASLCLPSLLTLCYSSSGQIITPPYILKQNPTPEVYLI